MGILNKHQCHLHGINGIEGHLHIVTHIHPGVALSDLVKNIKLFPCQFIKEKSLFTNFNGWQKGHGAFTYSYDNLPGLIDYVKSQEEHHKTITFRDEYMRLLKKHNITFEEKYPV